MGQIWSEHLPQPLLALQPDSPPILRQYYRLDNRLTPNRNIEQQKHKEMEGEGMEWEKAVQVRPGKGKGRNLAGEMLLRLWPRRSQPILPSFFFCLRGGVTGRPMFIPP